MLDDAVWNITRIVWCFPRYLGTDCSPDVRIFFVIEILVMMSRSTGGKYEDHLGSGMKKDDSVEELS